MRSSMVWSYNIALFVLYGASIFSLVGALAGCASNLKGVSNVGDVEVRKRANEYFIGEYAGVRPDCFPPITKEICHPIDSGVDQYENLERLRMEGFGFRIISRDFAPDLDSLLYLKAAKVGVQREFEFFTVLSTTTLKNCSPPGLDAVTSGVVDEDASGRSTGRFQTEVRRSPGSCYTSKSMDVIYFDKPEDLEKGVLVSSLSWRGDQEFISPEARLYYGTIPNVTADDMIDFDSSFGALTTTPRDAWRIRYDSSALLLDLKDKLGIDELDVVEYVNEKKIRRERFEKNPVLRHRVIDGE
ncbi:MULTISPECIES: hypothetical protein [unclassified Thioalkalivibrio]|uniref:hypothetical protein n=1 Tax=unclassified Thioalkalivibrio TaxID=2621013 RepID=UPI0012DDCEF1|nr:MULTISPECIES: hypothetical protein [unclassified Thioalkalivibrio]